MAVLYKYMKREHADLLVNQGSLRIGTLYEFRNEEKHGQAIGDNQEGLKSTYMDVNNASWTADTIPAFAKNILDVGEGATVKADGFRLIVPQNSHDYYVFCTTHEFDVSAMCDFGYDTCVVIESQEKFFRALSKRLKHKGRFQGTHMCHYQPRSMHYQMDTGVHAALIKEPEYSYQKEVRTIWAPKKTAIQPIIVQSRELTKYCHIKRGC